LWISHIEKINNIGLGNVHLLDSYKGGLYMGEGKILIDKTIVNQLKFIKEGQFVETDGEPTLRLIGEATNVIDANITATDENHPLRLKDICGEFGFNQSEMLAILWKLNIKGDKKHHNPGECN
jgi:hypothetical protein